MSFAHNTAVDLNHAAIRLGHETDRTAMNASPIAIRHNFTPDDFMWLWAKYVIGFNERFHCTNCLRGRYSHRFSKARNPLLAHDRELVFNEYEHHGAIYICGVARKGYSVKKNYAHNVHIAIHPRPGATSDFQFERWRVHVINGEVVPIVGIDGLPPRLRSLPDPFITCRIFRWAASFFTAHSDL